MLVGQKHLGGDRFSPVNPVYDCGTENRDTRRVLHDLSCNRNNRLNMACLCSSYIFAHRLGIVWSVASQTVYIQGRQVKWGMYNLLVIPSFRSRPVPFYRSATHLQIQQKWLFVHTTTLIQRFVRTIPPCLTHLLRARLVVRTHAL